MRGSAGRRRRPLRHRAQRGLHQGGARRPRRRRPLHGDRPCPHAERGRRRLRQRHRGAWRRFRRHLRGRSGACRRGGGAGGAGGLRAAPAGWRRGAARHRGRHRGDVPAVHGGAEGGAQGGLSPDRDLRRDGRGRRRVRRARLERQTDCRRARHRRQFRLWHHRISRGGRLDQAAASRLGGAIRHPRGALGARRVPRTAHRVRRRAWTVPRLRAHHARRLRGARRFRHALGDRDARLQALPVRHHGASVYRLREAPGRARHQAGAT